jgi:GNAT superfamily N-acetyltransferase
MLELPDGYSEVPAGKLASVVTCLEMLARPALRSEVANPSWTLRRALKPDAGWYRRLFEQIGGDWLWFSRLRLSAHELDAILLESDVHLYTLVVQDRDAGLLELDFRVAGLCELAFFGVARELQGSGAGRFLMNRAIEFAWAQPISRFWVHTCTLDHPAALSFYQRSGFRAYARRVEVVADPRLAGLLPRTSAPHVPIIEAQVPSP